MLVFAPEQRIKTYPYSIADLKRDNPQVSFPSNPSQQLLEEFGVYYVTPTEEPRVDALTHSAKEINPKLVDGKWVQNWKVVEHSEEELDRIYNRTSDAVRSRRYSLLSESDWTQVADAPVDAAAWRSYRSELRDITKQEGYPFNVQWPVPPEN